MSLIYKYDIEVSLRRVETLRRGERNNRNSYYLLKALLEVEDELKCLQTSIALLFSDSMKLLEDEQKEEYLPRAKFIDYIIHCKEFWSRAKVIEQILLPLFQTLCLVEGIGSTSRYVYEMMERATDTIEKCCDSNCALYEYLWPKINRARKRYYPSNASSCCFFKSYFHVF